MRRRLLAGTCIVAASAALTAAPARAQDAAEAATYQPYGEIVAHAGDESGVSIEAWSPMIQSDTALLFVDGRIGITDETDGYTNLGVGVRAMLGESVVLGGYGYFDFTRDESNRQFYGATFGAEVMTPRFELRANYYMPTTGDKYLGTEIDPTGTLTIAANELVERRDTMRFDLSAMDGADAEVGVRLFGSDDGSNDFRLYAGGYRYWDDVIDDVEGGYGEAEYRLHGLFGEGSFLSLAGRVSDDNLRGTDVSGQLRLRLSFGKPRGGAARLTGAESRMTERVRRRGPMMLQTRATPGTRDFDVINNLTGQAFGQFFFVDGANTAGSGDPDDATTLGDAATRAGAGDTIVAQGGAGTIATTGVTLADGASLVGGGGTTLQVRTENGGVVPFTLGTSAGTIANSDAAGNTITLGDGNVLAGFTLTGGANAIVGDGITGTTIRNVTISGVAQSGIALTDVAAASITDSDVTGGAAGAIAIGGTGAVSLSGLTLASSGGNVLSLDGTGGNLVIAKFADLTIAGGNGESGGVLVTDALFDANPATTGIDTVAGGDIAIGSATDRVGGGGLVLDGVLGAVAFGDVDIYTDGGAGLYVRDGEGKAGSFFFANDGGTIDAIGGAAVDIDPVTVDSTFDSLISTGSPGAGLIFDTVAGSFTVNGPTRITDPGTHGIVIVNSTADFSFGATEITGFSGTGADLRGASGDVEFASLDIEGDGSPGSKGIDISGSINTGFIGTSGPSSIKGVEVGVDLTGAQITGTFQFGDGSDTDGNGAASLIEADTPIVATDLGTAGTYNFLDAELVGDVSGLAGDEITVFFVDSTAGMGTADDPGTIAQAEASGADIIVLVNDGLGSLDAAGSGSDNTLLLAAGQRLTGFFGQDSFDYVQGGPQDNLLVHGMAAGVEITVDDPTGNGAATLTSSLSDALTASGNAQVDHVIIGSALDYGISINGISGTIAISDSQVSSLSVSGGSSVVSLVNTDLTGGSTKVLGVTGGHTGSVALDSTSSITDSIDDGLLFDSAAGTYTIAAPVTLTGGMIQVLNSSGTIDFTGAVTITDTDDNYPAAVYLTGANGAISFGTVDIVNPLAGGIRISGATDSVTFANASIGASTTPIAAVSITDQASTSTITFDTLDLTRTVDADANSFEIADSAGTITVTAGTFSKTGGGSDLINITGGSATITIGATLSDVSYGNGIDIEGITGGAITFTGDYTKTGGGNAAWIGFNAANTGGTIAFDGDVTVTDGANIVIYDTYSIAFNGTTSITAAGSNSVDVNGSNGTVSFADLDIAMWTPGTTGLELRDASFSGGFSAKDFDLTSNSPSITVGVDLRGTTGTVRLGDTVANGGGSASISGVATGVRIDNTSDVTFTFGDGENAVDVASVINVPGTAIDFGDNDGTVGSFNFLDVDWTQASNPSSYANLLSDFTIYYIDAEGDGDGSALNPGSFDDAGALAADVLIVVNQNPNDADFIDLQSSSQGSIGSYELQDGQGLFGFRGGDTLNLAQYGYSMGGAPTNFQFTAIAGIGNQIENPGLGTGSPIIQGGPDTITVSSDAHAVIGGVWLQTLGNAAVSAGNARSLIIADSVLYGLIRGLSIEAPSSASIMTDRTFTIRNSEFSGSFSEGLYLLSPVGNNVTLDISGSLFMGGLTPGLYVGTTPGGEVTLALSDVTALSGTYGIELVNDNGGFTITDFDQITVTDGQHGVRVAGGVVFDADTATSGWQTVEASSLTIGSSETPLVGAGLVLDSVLGALSIDDLQLHVQQGPALYIDGSANSIGDFTFIVGGGDIDATQVASGQDAMYLNYITSDITLDSFTAKLGQNGVNLNHVAGGGAEGNALTIGTLTLDGMSGYGMLLQSVEGDVTVTDGAIGGTDDTGGSGVGITGGTANFAIGADITKTTGGKIVDINGGDPESVTFSGALSATGGFDNGIAVANLGSGAISFTGPVTLSTGANTAIAISNNADAVIGFSGGLDIDTTTGTGIQATGGSTLTVTDSADISNTITTTGGTALYFHTFTIGDAGATFDSIDVTGALYGLYINDLSQTEDSTGLDILDGSIAATQDGGYGAYILETSADIAIGADLSAASTAYRSLAVDSAGRADGLQSIVVSGAIDDNANGIYLYNNDQNGGLATITLSGTIDIDTKAGAYEGFQALEGGNLSVTGQMSVDTVGSTAGVVLSNNSGSTLSFSSGGNGLAITTAGGTALAFGGGGTLNVTAQTSITTGSGNGLMLSGGSATFNAGGTGLDVTTGSGIGLNASQTTLTILGNANSLSTTSGQVLALTDTTIGQDGANLASVTASSANGSGGTIYLTNLDGGALDIGTVNITGGTNGIHLGTIDADIAFGDVTLSGQSWKALDATGTSTGAISFDSLSIALTGSNSTGVTLDNAVLNGDFTVTDFDLTSVSATGTYGIRLNGATGTGTVRFGDTDTAGESATIVGVGTGVLLNDASAINFIFGDGEGTIDVGSSISATTAIDFGNATGANGTFNFLDVTFPTSGSIANLESSADVYWIDAEGNGDGSRANPGSFAGAAGYDVIVLVNTNGTIQDVINLAAPSQGVNSYTLTDGQVLASFAASDTLNLADYGIDVGGAPSNLLLSNIAGAVITNPYAGYAPQLISGADVSSAIVLANGSTTWIDGVLFGDTGDTQSAIGGTAFTNFTLTNSTIRANGVGITLALGGHSNATNAIATITDSTIISAGTALSFSSGNGDLLSIKLDDVSAKSNGGKALDVGLSGTGNAIVAINDLTLEGPAMSTIATSAIGTGEITITAFADVTALGTGLSINSLSGGYEITFDADLDTPGLQAVDGGDLNIGTSGSPVSGYGLALSTVSGQLDFDEINIYSSGNAGLYVYNQTLETVQPALGFTLTSDGGAIWSQNARALEIDSITLGMDLDSVSASGSAGGISIDQTSGAMNILGGAISTTSGIGALITNSTLDFTYGGTITNATTGRTISVSGQSDGTITFAGKVTERGQGVALMNNTGGAIDFTGGLDIVTTGIDHGLSATGGGTLTVQGAGNRITAAGGSAITMDGVAIGAAGMTFETINKNGNTGTGIYIKNGGTAGFFTVTGVDGNDLDALPDAGSGGTIQNIGDAGSNSAVTAGVGAYFEGTGNISLNNMVIGNGTAIENYAIRGRNVTNFTLRDSTIAGTFGDAGSEAAIYFDNLTGVALFEGNTISGGYTDNLAISNDTGTLDLFIRDSANNAAVFGHNASSTGADAVSVEAFMDANIRMLVDGVEFTGWRGYAVYAGAFGTSNLDATIRNNTFDNGHAAIPSSGGTGVRIDGSTTGGSWGVDYSIEDNTFSGSLGSSIQAEFSGHGGTIRGFIDGNTIGTADGTYDATGGMYGILVGAQHDSAGSTLAHYVTISNNTIRDVSQIGVYVRAGGGLNASENGVMELTMTNNSIGEMTGALTISALRMNSGTLTGQYSVIRSDISNNVFSIAGAPFTPIGPVWLYSPPSSSATFEFPNYVIGTDGDNLDIIGYLTGKGNTFGTAGGQQDTTGPQVYSPGTVLNNGSLQPAQTGSNTDLPVAP